MGVGRNDIARGGELHIICPLDYYIVARFESGDDFGADAVAFPETHFLLSVAAFIYLQIYEIQPLFFSQGRDRHCKHTCARLRQQPDFGERAWHYSLPVPEFESDRYVIR